MKTKRILSIVLTLAMLLGMFPGMSLTASAADSTTEITPSNTSGTMTITLTIKAAQTITASDVTATYGDTDKSVSASVTTPATGGGAISYTVKDGSGDYIDVASDGKLTIKKVPASGKAYVIVKAAETDDYAETTKEVTVTISKAEATVAAKDQGIMVGGTVPDLSAPVLNTHYSVTGLVGTDALTTAPTLAYQKNGSAATPDNTTAGTYNIVPSGASAGDNYNISYTNGTLTITAKDAQTITASDVTATYGETDKSVSATTDGNGEISYAVKAGSEDYISVASDGKLTIKKVPADGKAYVTVTASETTTGGTGDKGYAAATKDVTVNISKATVTITAKDQSIYVGGTVPTLSGADFYTVTGLVGEETLTTNPTLAYQKNGSAVTPDNTTAGTYDIVPSGAAASDNYSISYTNGTLTISNKGTQTISAENVTVTYGDTDKSVSATVTDPATGGGDISYAVKEGSGDYIEINASTGALTIKAVPADGKAYVIVTAAETSTYTQATKEVTVTINKANAVAATVTANNRTYDGTEKPLVTVTGTPTGGTMQYALGTATEATQPYTTAIPTATNAGTYNVYFKVSGNNNYNDYEGSATVTISKKPVAANISADDKTYDGKTDATVSASVKPEDLVSGDSIEITGLTGNFIDANAGEDKKVTVDSSAKQISGTGSDNYEVSIPEETTASITHLITEVKEVPATCTETGKKQHWKDEEGTLYKDAEGKETATEAELVIPALEHDWNNPTYEWAEDNSTVTATRTCKNDASHIETETAKTTSKVTKDATETEEGETTYTATFKNLAFTEQTKTESIPKLEPEEEVTYSNTKGNGTQWTKGSTSTADFTFKRSKNDSETFSHFTGIQVDGKDVAASNYTAESGSVIVKLKPSYLETLSVGEHTITALFDDGSKASAKFTVVARKASGNSNTTNSTTKKANTVSSTGAPKTGDTSNMLLWFTILCASVLVLFNVVTIRRRNTMGHRR